MERLCSKTSSFRLFKMLSLLFVFLALKGSISIALDIKTGKEETCSQETMVSAIVENHNKHSVAYLFSGHNVWSLNLKDGKLIKVERTSDVFKGVTETDIINAAGGDKFTRNYYLYGFENGYEITHNDTTLKPIENMNENLEKYFNAKMDNKDNPVICSASYLTSENTATLFLVFTNGRIWNCDMPKVGQGKCHRYIPRELRKIPEPEIRKCEGLLVGNAIEGTYNGEYRLLFASKDALYYWIGDKLIYKKSMNDLFNCMSLFITIVVAASVLAGIAILIAIVTVVVFILRERSRRLKQVAIADTTTVKTVKPIENRGKQLSGNDSNAAKEAK